MFPYLPAIYIALRHSEIFSTLAEVSAFLMLTRIIWNRSIPVLAMET